MEGDLVVKVGGSLYDLADLGCRLRAWLDQQPTPRILIVPGGGPVAEWVRNVDKAEPLGEEKSHWLALRALTLTGHVLAARLPGGMVIEALEERESAWQSQKWPILDLLAFARSDEARADHLEHSWEVTSDSLAARVAIVAGITQLVLLKSCSIAEHDNWHGAARDGFVDAAFSSVLAAAPLPLRVTAVNFRSWQSSAASAVAPRGPAP